MILVVIDNNSVRQSPSCMRTVTDWILNILSRFSQPMDESVASFSPCLATQDGRSKHGLLVEPFENFTHGIP